jgi:hypothetical protein
MEKLVASLKNYSIWESDAAHLYEVSRFAVLENYRHHAAAVCDTETLHAEITSAYRDDLQYISCSRTFVARNTENRLVGSSV